MSPVEAEKAAKIKTPKTDANAESPKPAKVRKTREPKPKTVQDQALAALKRHDRFDAMILKINTKRAAFVQATSAEVSELVSKLRAALSS